MTETAQVDYRAITVQAWSAMFVVLLAIQLRTFVESPRDDFSPGGLLWMFCTCLNPLVQVGVRTLDSPRFRRAVFEISVAYTTLIILDHFLASSLAVEGFNQIFYFLHHVLGLWACWASWRWFRLARLDAPSIHRWTPATASAPPNEGPHADGTAGAAPRG